VLSFSRAFWEIEAGCHVKSACKYVWRFAYKLHRPYYFVIPPETSDRNLVTQTPPIVNSASPSVDLPFASHPLLSNSVSGDW